MKLLTKIKKTAFPETWCVAVRKINGESECLINNTESPFTVLPNSDGLWCADPFLFEKDGILYVFFEVLDQMKRKGMLGYRTLDENGAGDIHIIYEGDSHLSFPYIYEEDGEIFIMPEASHSNSIFRLKCNNFPDKWEMDSTLIEGSFVDSVLYQTDCDKLIITQKVDSDNNYNRVDILYSENGKYKESENNPVKEDLKTARGAGKFFEFNGLLIRPSQDCSEGYGGRLNFNKIVSLNKNEIKEETVKSVSADEIKTDKDIAFCGIHTYNRLGDYEVIDLKLPTKFSARNSIGAAIKVVKGE